jgi:hypothetical protein
MRFRDIEAIPNTLTVAVCASLLLRTTGVKTRSMMILVRSKDRPPRSGDYLIIIIPFR